MKPLIINETDRSELKEIIRYLGLAREAARQSDHITFRTLINHSEIKKAIMEPLEKIARWNNESDTKTITRISQKINDEFSGKTTEKIYEKIEKAFDNRNEGMLGRIISSLKKKKSTKNDYLELKKIIGYLKIISSFNYTIFNSLIEGKDFELIVMIPLKEIVGWEKDDDDDVKELYQKIKNKTEKKKTMKGKGDKIIKMLKTGGKVAVGVGIAGAIGTLIYYLLKKKTKKTEE